MATIRTAEDRDMERIRAFYRVAEYRGDVGSDDRVLLADESETLVGVVRLARENGTVVLRGMRVLPDYQRAGIGTLLLEAVSRSLGSEECYCIAYEHLCDFYGRIGFRTLDPLAAPQFLADRIKEYRMRRPERFSLMLRRAPQFASPSPALRFPANLPPSGRSDGRS
jgi:GNAT superfamily N-acetyltransferase